LLCHATEGINGSYYTVVMMVRDSFICMLTKPAVYKGLQKADLQDMQICRHSSFCVMSSGHTFCTDIHTEHYQYDSSVFSFHRYYHVFEGKLHLALIISPCELKVVQGKCCIGMGLSFSSWLHCLNLAVSLI